MLLHQCFRALNAMNVVEIDKVARSSARGESQCRSCGRPWFGSVAYCPYCGRKPSFTTINQDPGDRIQGDAAVASGPATSGMPAVELHRPQPISPRKEPRGTPLLFKALAAGVGVLLLLWVALKPPAPKTTEPASPQLPISAPGIASPRPAAPTSAAQVPSIPPRTGAAVPSKPIGRLLCSEANEAQGLCKSQE